MLISSLMCFARFWVNIGCASLLGGGGWFGWADLNVLWTILDCRAFSGMVMGRDGLTAKESGRETEREVNTKSVVQNNTLVPLLQNVRSEDPPHQLAGLDAGNYCCSYKSWDKYTLSRGSLLCVACCSVCNQDQNGIKQSISILLGSQGIKVTSELQKLTDQQTKEVWHPFCPFNHC